MVKEIEKQLDTLNLTSNDTLIVAVSGGPDSMALLSFLLDYQMKVPYRIVCAHVNHNVRKESVFEEQFVSDFCKQHNIIFECLSVQEWDSSNFHEQAHQKRYAFFESLVEKYQGRYLFTAHHGDDFVETILMHIVRGSTLKGYRGFQKVEQRKNYTFVRPLLDYTKSEILDFVKSNNIPYVIDASNDKDKYTRNRYRKYVLPFLKKEEPKLISKFQQFSKTLYLYEREVENEFQQIYPQIVQNGVLNISLWKEKSELMQEKILQKMLEEYYCEQLSYIKHRHVELLKQFICSSKPNAYIEFPGGMIVERKYNQLSFVHQNFTTFEYNMILDKDLILSNEKTISFLNKPEDFSNFSCCLSSKEIKLPLHVRNRKNGDKMEVKGLNGHQKVKDIFINEKIPLEDRNKWPVVTDDQDVIVWIPGLKKSKFSKTKEENYDIILRYH